jgi:hypothetical protein
MMSGSDRTVLPQVIAGAARFQQEPDPISIRKRTGAACALPGLATINLPLLFFPPRLNRRCPTLPRLPTGNITSWRTGKCQKIDIQVVPRRAVQCENAQRCTIPPRLASNQKRPVGRFWIFDGSRLDGPARLDRPWLSVRDNSSHARLVSATMAQ